MGIRPLLGAFLLVAMSVPALADDVVQAQWREIKAEFPFVSRTTDYYCHQVNRKVKRVLQRAGAHPDTKVTVRGCAFEQPSNQLYFIVETAVTVLAPSKRKPDATPSEPTRWGSEPFPATWQQINLAHERDATLLPNDCELMRTLEAYVFSQMTVTVDEKPQRCRFDATQRRMQDFVITALTPVPDPK